MRNYRNKIKTWDFSRASGLKQARFPLKIQILHATLLTAAYPTKEMAELSSPWATFSYIVDTLGAWLQSFKPQRNASENIRMKMTPQNREHVLAFFLGKGRWCALNGNRIEFPARMQSALNTYLLSKVSKERPLPVRSARTFWTVPEYA